MKQEIESFLREQSEGANVPLLEPAVITEAGREHLLSMRKHAEEEIAQIKQYLGQGEVKISQIPGIVENIEKLETFIRNVDETVPSPDERYVEFVKIGETESYATHGTKFEGSDEWKFINVDWELWDLLGSPQVIKILK